MVDPRDGSAIPLTRTESEWRPLRLAGRVALSRAQALALAGTFALATALRLHGIVSWAFEHDEAFTYFRALELAQLNARPLYFLIHRAFLELLPHDPFYQRLPSLAFGLAGVWATWVLGRRVFGTVAGLVAAGLVAISPWHIFFSQFARYWSLVYLLSAVLYHVLPHAVDTDRRGRYLAALALILIGTLSHPTFLFPLVGIIPVLLLVRRSGELAWRWPSRRAWRLLWGPLAGLASAGLALLAITRNLGALRNGHSRGIEETLRLVPAMIQWTGVVVVAATVVGGTWLLAYRPRDRRWAAMALLGGAASLTLLLAASFTTAVYSDYGFPILPLVFVTIGGAVQRLAEAVHGRGARSVPAAALAVLVAGTLPSTLSHLSDGSRHDPRPAYARIAAEIARGRHAPVYGSAPEIQRFHAPWLDMVELEPDPAHLDRALQRSGGLWLIGFYRREGMVLASERVAAWARRHCHVVLRTQRPRLDYRVYRIELHWCGDGRTVGALPVGMPAEDDRDRPQDDPDVLENGATLDVLEVVTQLAAHVLDRQVVALMELREADHPGKHPLAVAVAVDPLAQAIEDPRLLGARADDVHVAAQHVEELRQLVQAGPAQHAADGRHPGVVRRRPRFAVAVRPHVHRSELVDAEQRATVVVAATAAAAATRSASAVQADARLRVQDGARRGQPDQQRDRDEQRSAQHDRDRGDADAQHPAQTVLDRRRARRRPESKDTARVREPAVERRRCRGPGSDLRRPPGVFVHTRRSSPLGEGHARRQRRDRSSSCRSMRR